MLSRDVPSATIPVSPNKQYDVSAWVRGKLDPVTTYVYYPSTSQGGRLLNIKSGTAAAPTSLSYGTAITNLPSGNTAPRRP